MDRMSRDELFAGEVWCRRGMGWVVEGKAAKVLRKDRAAIGAMG